MVHGDILSRVILTMLGKIFSFVFLKRIFSKVLDCIFR